MDVNAKAVYAFDPFCCNTIWDATCASDAPGVMAVTTMAVAVGVRNGCSPLDGKAGGCACELCL